MSERSHPQARSAITEITSCEIITNRLSPSEASGTSIEARYNEDRGTKSPAERISRTYRDLVSANRFLAEVDIALQRYGAVPGTAILAIDDAPEDGGGDRTGVAEAGSIRAPYPDHLAMHRRALKRGLILDYVASAAAAIDAADETTAGHSWRLFRYLAGWAGAAVLAAEVGVCEDTMLKRLRLGVHALGEHYRTADDAPDTLPPVRGEMGCGEWYSRSGPAFIATSGPYWPPASAPRAALIRGMSKVTTPQEAAALSRSQFRQAASHLNNALRFSDLRGWPAEVSTVNDNGKTVPAVAYFAGIAGHGSRIPNAARDLRDAGMISADAKLPPHQLTLLLLGALWDEPDVDAPEAALKLFKARSVDAEGNRIGSALGTDLADLMPWTDWLIFNPSAGSVLWNGTIDGQSLTQWYWTADHRQSVAYHRQVMIDRFAIPDWWKTEEAQSLDFANETRNAIVYGHVIKTWARHAGSTPFH